MVAVCAETGYILGLPLKAKSQVNLMAHEILAFTQVLGHEEVTYYSDNEPTLRQVARLLVQARGAVGLKTKMRQTKIYDHAGNALAENAIQRVRSVAATLMENVTQRTGLRFSGQRPLWSWACRHSAWLLNRYQATQGATSFEWIYGRPTLCQYGEVVFAYTKPKQGFKGDPRWKVGVCLGKSEMQDAWVIGDGSRMFLSRSIRRVDDSWARYLQCIRGFSAYSWEFQTTFGGRIVPSKRLVTLEGPKVSLTLPGTQDELAGDDEAREILAYARSYAGRLEDHMQREDVEKEPQKRFEDEEKEKKVAEDKRLNLEERVPEETVVAAPMPPEVDDSRNQAGPSRPSAFSLLESPSTPRSHSQPAGSPEPETKKYKLTAEKRVHGVEGEESDSKRQKSDMEDMRERRITATQIGDDIFYQRRYGRALHRTTQVDGGPRR